MVDVATFGAGSTLYPRGSPAFLSRPSVPLPLVSAKLVAVSFCFIEWLILQFFDLLNFFHFESE
jgi:hypothetical protein